MSLIPEGGYVGLSQVSRGIKIKTTQTLALVGVITVCVGASLFYAMQRKSPQDRNAECLSAATTIPLVNTTTGVGMTAALAECEANGKTK